MENLEPRWNPSMHIFSKLRQRIENNKFMQSEEVAMISLQVIVDLLPETEARVSSLIQEQDEQLKWATFRLLRTFRLTPLAAILRSGAGSWIFVFQLSLLSLQNHPPTLTPKPPEGQAPKGWCSYEGLYFIDLMISRQSPPQWIKSEGGSRQPQSSLACVSGS